MSAAPGKGGTVCVSCGAPCRDRVLLLDGMPRMIVAACDVHWAAYREKVWRERSAYAALIASGVAPAVAKAHLDATLTGTAVAS